MKTIAELLNVGHFLAKSSLSLVLSWTKNVLTEIVIGNEKLNDRDEYVNILTSLCNLALRTTTENELRDTLTIILESSKAISRSNENCKGIFIRMSEIGHYFTGSSWNSVRELGVEILKQLPPLLSDWRGVDGNLLVIAFGLHLREAKRKVNKGTKMISPTDFKVCIYTIKKIFFN